MSGKETVLLAGATGNIGVSVIITALRRNMNVLALVRNKESAREKILKHLDYGETLPKDSITFVETDVTKDGAEGIQGVVDKVKQGELPEFQHVYATVGWYFRAPVPIFDVNMEDVRDVMQICFYSNFYAYKYAVPYLLTLKKPTTFTLITGASRSYGTSGITAVSQGALASLCAVGARELAETNVRFNEVYLAFRVEYDSNIESGDSSIPGVDWGTDWSRASEFAPVYDRILRDEKIKGMQVNVMNKADMDGSNYEEKIRAK